ncbi:ATP-binding protein [Adlercreutzia sp. ZJ304]|uniref:ATP-binding protein n=1 Tax=Adlercreutzia sp. ZJ304 TaxID=2709791 RepID=UPI0013EC49D9|nr:ATP-binding protein [Adlercreutzia sp. ZJ304]
MNLGQEDEYTEFKKTTSELKEGMESIAAILNKHGKGVLYFGVNPDGEVCGQDVSESTLRKISQAIGNSIDPTIYPIVAHEKTPDGRDYVKVAFSGDDGPYTCNGKYRIRRADEDVIMSPSQLRHHFKEAENRVNPWDGRISDKTVDDADEDTLRKFVERGQKEGRIPFPYTNAKEVLERLGLLEGDNLRNAAAVLFCPSIYTGIKMGILASHARTDILDLKQEAGIFFDLIDKGEYYIISNIRNRVDTSTGGPSPVYFEIPRAAIREALMNAFAHRDWQTYDAVVVDIYSDAVEITSPGWFIEGQDPDRHLSGEDNSSISRNPLISRTLYRSGDIEAYGTGIKRIKESCDAANIRVEYVRVPSGTKLVFHRNDAFAQVSPGDTVPDVTVNDTVNVTVKNPQTPLRGKDSRNAKILELIARDSGITAEEIAETTAASVRTVRRALKELQDNGKLLREGSDKAGRWIVVESKEQ